VVATDARVSSRVDGQFEFWKRILNSSRRACREANSIGAIGDSNPCPVSGFAENKMAQRGSGFYFIVRCREKRYGKILREKQWKERRRFCQTHEDQPPATREPVGAVVEERTMMHRARPITVQLRAAAARSLGRCFVFCILYCSSSSLRLYITRSCLGVYFSFRTTSKLPRHGSIRLWVASLSPTAEKKEGERKEERQPFRNLHLSYLTSISHFS